MVTAVLAAVLGVVNTLASIAFAIEVRTHGEHGPQCAQSLRCTPTQHDMCHVTPRQQLLTRHWYDRSEESPVHDGERGGRNERKVKSLKSNVVDSKTKKNRYEKKKWGGAVYE